MERLEIIQRLQKYFKIQELVDKRTYDKYHEFAWNFFDTALLETLLTLREDILKAPMTINDWHRGGKFQERGIRHNLSNEVMKYTNAKPLAKQTMTAHSTGKGVDFDVKGMTAEEVRQRIIKEGGNLPHPIRLEKDVTWVHCDIYNDGRESKVIQFKV